MADQMRTELVLTALGAALGQQGPSQMELVSHSDQGSQYADGDHWAALFKANLTFSMSRRDNC